MEQYGAAPVFLGNNPLLSGTEQGYFRTTPNVSTIIAAPLQSPNDTPHWACAMQPLVWTLTSVEGEVFARALPQLAHRAIALHVYVLVLDAPPQSLHKEVVASVRYATCHSRSPPW